MSALDKKYTPATVARAANIVPRAVTNWASLGKITGHRESPGTGRERLFSFWQLVEVALAAEIQRRLGLRSVEDAFEAAREFAMAATGEATWRDAPDPAAPARLPGLPFHPDLGRTLLIFSVERAEVRLEPGAALRLEDLPTAAIVVDAGAIFGTICARLDLNARAICDEAYGEGRP
jgi:hypothetical protein